MSNFCINCGHQGTLVPVDENPDHVSPMLERGEWDEASGQYSREQDVTILSCAFCQHEMIDLSG